MKHPRATSCRSQPPSGSSTVCTHAQSRTNTLEFQTTHQSCAHGECTISGSRLDCPRPPGPQRKTASNLGQTNAQSSTRIQTEHVSVNFAPEQWLTRVLRHFGRHFQQTLVEVEVLFHVPAVLLVYEQRSPQMHHVHARTLKRLLIRERV